MKLKELYNLLTGKTSALKPAKLTFRNILAVIQSFFRKSMGGILMKRHIYEQIIWRRIKVMDNSPKCWQSGHCIVCGCEILGKTMEDRGCSASESPELNISPCYPDMMSKKEWNQYKITNNIKLFN